MSARASRRRLVRSCRQGQQTPHADDVVRRRSEGEDPGHEWSAAVAQLPEAADRFHPAEALLDELAVQYGLETSTSI